MRFDRKAWVTKVNKLEFWREIKNSCKRARCVRLGLLYLPMKFQAESFRINGAIEAETG